MGADVRQFAWSRQGGGVEGQAPCFLVLTGSGQLQVHRFGAGPLSEAAGVQAADWAPDGQLLVLSHGSQLEIKPAAALQQPALAGMHVKHPDGACACTA